MWLFFFVSIVAFGWVMALARGYPYVSQYRRPPASGRFSMRANSLRPNWNPVARNHFLQPSNPMLQPSGTTQYAAKQPRFQSVSYNNHPKSAGANYLTAAVYSAQMAALNRALNPQDEMEVPLPTAQTPVIQNRNGNWNHQQETYRPRVPPSVPSQPAYVQQSAPPVNYAPARVQPSAQINKDRIMSSFHIKTAEIDRDPVADLLSQVQKLQAISYSKSKCRKCRYVENLLEATYRIPVTVFHLDQLSRGRELLEFMGEITEGSDLPQIFICGSYVGGYTDIMKLHRRGLLWEFTKGCAR